MTHPVEAIRLWKHIAEHTELNHIDADIAAISCSIFGKLRGKMALEALKVI